MTVLAMFRVSSIWKKPKDRLQMDGTKINEEYVDIYLQMIFKPSTCIKLQHTLPSRLHLGRRI